tara:strand:- start:4829 stop:5353 length:525 start_codon:yes stop_codon:yes gene_type:complete
MSYMDIQTIDKQKMDSLTALASTNIAISQAKATLEELKKSESAYIKVREEKVLASIQAMLYESKEITKETSENYTGVQELLKNTKILAQFVVEAHGEFKELVKVFEKASENWDQEVKEVQKELADTRKQIEVSKIQVKNDLESIEKRKKEVQDEERKIKDQRETLERAFARLGK